MLSGVLNARTNSRSRYNIDFILLRILAGNEHLLRHTRDPRILTQSISPEAAVCPKDFTRRSIDDCTRTRGDVLRYIPHINALRSLPG